nr:MAG TPA: hypothetical protein [Caudoviricetes sp.]
MNSACGTNRKNKSPITGDFFLFVLLSKNTSNRLSL